MSTKPASNEAMEPVAIAEREPVFPCWLWAACWDQWYSSRTFVQGSPDSLEATHWLPDSPARPTVKPEQK